MKVCFFLLPFKTLLLTLKRVTVFIVIMLFYLSGNSQKTNIDSLLVVQFQKQTSESEKLNLAKQLFFIYRDSCPDKALFYGNMAVQKAESLGEESELANLYVEIGRTQENETNFYNSLECYSKAFKIYEDQENWKEVGKIHHYLAKNYKRLGLYDQALTNSLAALEIFEEYKDSVRTGWSYNNLGSVYKYMEEYDKAINYYNKYLSISQKSGNVDAIPTALNNMGVVYERMGNLVLAKSNYERAVELYSSEKKKNRLAIYLNNLGGIYLKQNNYAKAKVYFLKALDIQKMIADKRRIAISYGDLGNYYYKVDSLKEAKEYYVRSLTILSDSGDAELLRRLYYRMHLVYIRKNEYKKAYEYFVRCDSIDNDLLNSNAIKKITNLEWQQKFSDVQKQEHIERAKSKFITLTSIVILCFLLLFILFLFRRHKAQLKIEQLAKENSELQKKQVESELELKNKKLANYALRLVKNDEISERIIRRLEQAKGNLKKENQPIIQSIIFDLKSEQKADTWKEFEIRFLEVHHDFYNNLSEKYKDLTQNEQRLCAFLKLNMSTKEISSITHQTPHSINIARGRLRKKLAISGINQDLHEFLSQF